MPLNAVSNERLALHKTKAPIAVGAFFWGSTYAGIYQVSAGFARGAAMITSRNLEAAQHYFGAGLALYVANEAKKPLIKGWNDAGAVRNEKHLEALFKQFPEAQLGIATGPSRIVVLDVDPRNGGNESLLKLTGDVGLQTFEACPIASTPSGGQHIYFHAPQKRIRSGEHVFGRGIDVKALGGGVLAPPSRRSSGEYSWRTPGGEFPDFEAIPELPDILVERILARKVKAVSSSFPRVLESGQRNANLYRAGGRLARIGVGYDMMLTVLLALNAKHCTPPLPEKEIRMISESAASRHTVDCAVWFQRWAPRLETPSERVLAAALVNVAEFACGPLTPATARLAQLTGIHDGRNLRRVRQALAQHGAIEVKNRGRELAAEIRLLLPEDPAA